MAEAHFLNLPSLICCPSASFNLGIQRNNSRLCSLPIQQLSSSPCHHQLYTWDCPLIIAFHRVLPTVLVDSTIDTIQSVTPVRWSHSRRSAALRRRWLKIQFRTRWVDRKHCHDILGLTWFIRHKTSNFLSTRRRRRSKTRLSLPLSLHPTRRTSNDSRDNFKVLHPS